MSAHPEFLDQEQIDARFGVADDVAPAAGPVEAQPYRFTLPARPRPATGDGIRALHEGFARHLRERLTFRLRKPATVTLESSEIFPFSDLCLALGDPAAAYSFPVGSEAGVRGILDWGIPTAFVLVDRLLGGPGHAYPKSRPLSTIEQVLLRRLSAEIVSLLRDGAREHFAVEPEGIRYEPRLAGSRLADPGARFCAIPYRIRIERFEGLVTVAFPSTLVAPAPGTTVADKAGEDDSAFGRILENSVVLGSRMAVAVRLPLLTLRMGEISGLTPGSTIDTGHPVESPVRILVNGRHLFHGSIGQSRGRFAARIANVAVNSAPERMTNAKQGRVQ